MRCLARFVNLLDSEGMFLSESARVELPQLGMRLCKTYTKLATKALRENRKAWKPSPKLHMFQHLCEWQGLIVNPRFCWCYSDEDLVGQLIDVADSCHSRTLASTAMFKWLTLVYGEIAPEWYLWVCFVVGEEYACRRRQKMFSSSQQQHRLSFVSQFRPAVFVIGYVAFIFSLTLSCLDVHRVIRVEIAR